MAVLPDGLDHNQRRSGGIWRNTSIPYFWLSINPCSLAASTGCPRWTS